MPASDTTPRITVDCHNLSRAHTRSHIAESFVTVAVGPVTFYFKSAAEARRTLERMTAAITTASHDGGDITTGALEPASNRPSATATHGQQPEVW